MEQFAAWILQTFIFFLGIWYGGQLVYMMLYLIFNDIADWFKD